MSVKRNVVANYMGRGWTALLGLVFVPLYIRFLGVEAYGLIGIYISLVGLLVVLDLGLSTTLNRILARHSAADIHPSEVRDLVRTFEIIAAVVGVAISVAIYAIAPWLAAEWIHQEGLALETVVVAVRLMGGAIALQWPASLYAGGLMGLQRQTVLNVVRSGIATVQGGGSVLILWLISPTIQAFFLWQLFVYAIQVLLLRRMLSESLPPTPNRRAQFDLKWLIHNWRFSIGTIGITLLATILTQLDKIILSNQLSLSAFGYYALAVVVSTALISLAAPIFSAAFPRFSQLYAEGSERQLAELYHKMTQLLSFLIVPIGVTIALFSEQVLSLWIRDPDIVANVSPILRVMIVGTVANALMTMPLALQLASGWTKLSFYKNLIAVILFVPLLVGLINSYGAVGGALSWVVLNLGYILFEPLIMHKRILKSEIAEWYVKDIGVVVLISLAISGAFLPISRSYPHSSLPFILSLMTCWSILAAGVLRRKVWTFNKTS